MQNNFLGELAKELYEFEKCVLKEIIADKSFLSLKEEHAFRYALSLARVTRVVCDKTRVTNMNNFQSKYRVHLFDILSSCFKKSLFCKKIF